MPPDATVQNQEQQGVQQQGQTQPQGTPSQPKDFDTWLEEQGTEVKTLYESHVANLKKAAQSEREQRKHDTDDLAKKLRDATKKLEEGSEARKSLDETIGKLEAAEQRAAFYEDAARPEVGCNNPRLGFIAALEIGAIDAKGRIHWDDLKAQFPQLFTMRVPNANAGTGTGSPPAGKVSMNDWIRRAAGKTT